MQWKYLRNFSLNLINSAKGTTAFNLVPECQDSKINKKTKIEILKYRRTQTLRREKNSNSSHYWLEFE
jgi:hypothetical protein